MRRNSYVELKAKKYRRCEDSKAGENLLTKMKSTDFFITFFCSCLFYLSRIEANKDKPESEGIPAADQIPRSSRASLISFKPFGENVNVGMEILLPFLRMPSKQKFKRNDNNQALVTVNSAAITVGGLISAFGIFVGHILRSIFTLRGREDVNAEDSNLETRSHSAEHRLDFEGDSRRFSRVLEPFKLVYRNSSGGRVDASLKTLFHNIEDTLFEKDVDLSACLQKSLCSLVRRTNLNMEKGTASGTEKIIDGLLHSNWIIRLSHKTTIEDAILAGQPSSADQCVMKYPTCKWDAPEEKLYYLISQQMKFA